MTIDEGIKYLQKAKELVGGDEEFVVMSTFGENDYIKPDFMVCEDLEDQDGSEYRCTFIGSTGGEELTIVGTPHYKWKPGKFKVEI